MTTIKRRRVEITIFEQERVVRRSVTARCQICNLNSEMVTPEEAGDLAQVQVQSIYQWLEQGKVHGMKTPYEEYRVCRNSLPSESCPP
ncbi:MAG: hypothetical protein AABN95_22470 [Acidobacteriota bacterium]